MSSTDLQESTRPHQPNHRSRKCSLPAPSSLRLPLLPALSSLSPPERPSSSTRASPSATLLRTVPTPARARAATATASVARDASALTSSATALRESAERVFALLIEPKYYTTALRLTD